MTDTAPTPEPIIPTVIDPPIVDPTTDPEPVPEPVPEDAPSLSQVEANAEPVDPAPSANLVPDDVEVPTVVAPVDVVAPDPTVAVDPPSDPVVTPAPVEPIVDPIVETPPVPEIPVVEPPVVYTPPAPVQQKTFHDSREIDAAKAAGLDTPQGPAITAEAKLILDTSMRGLAAIREWCDHIEREVARALPH